MALPSPSEGIPPLMYRNAQGLCQSLSFAYTGGVTPPPMDFFLSDEETFGNNGIPCSIHHEKLKITTGITLHIQCDEIRSYIPSDHPVFVSSSSLQLGPNILDVNTPLPVNIQVGTIPMASPSILVDFDQLIWLIISTRDGSASYEDLYPVKIFYVHINQFYSILGNNFPDSPSSFLLSGLLSISKESCHMAIASTLKVIKLQAYVSSMRPSHK